MSDDTKPYEVGYKRPPPAHRFKPGQSGKPAGRPKGRRNLRSLVKDAANSEISVTSGSKRTTMTKAEAFIEVLFKAALSGNTKVYRLLMETLERFHDDDAGLDRDPQLLERERELVSQILRARGAGDEPRSD